MPWSTQPIASLRASNAAAIAAKLGLAVLPNGEVRVLADANAANAGLNLEYLDWQAKQLLPDTAEQQFLDKWATIFLTNADGSRGRKVASFAAGTVNITATAVTALPASSLFQAGNVLFTTPFAVTLGVGSNVVVLRALDAGSVGNLAVGSSLSIVSAIVGVSGAAGITVATMAGGADEESDDELRVRVLDRIRQPPMGGDADDYVAWALDVAGVTRAWCSPNEMGMGTVTVRFMCDDLRASTGGFPQVGDVSAVQAYLDSVRPVTVRDLFVVAPIPYPIDFGLANLVGDSVALRASIKVGVQAMLGRRAAPASALNGVPQPATTISMAWVSEAVYAAVGGVSYDLEMADAPMPSPGHLAILGSVS